MSNLKTLGVAMAALAFVQSGCATKGTTAITTKTISDKGAGTDKETYDRQTISNQFWWPERLDLAPLRQRAAESNPLDQNVKYAQEFRKLDLKAVKSDIQKVLTTPGILDFRHGGSDFSRLAVQSTIVDPASNRTLAIEVFVKPR